MKNLQEITYSDLLETYTKTPTNLTSQNRIKLMRKYLEKSLAGSTGRLKVLDLGCGDGELFKDYVKSCEMYGADISPNLLKKAKKNGFKTFKVDMEKQKLPFRNGFFDVVITGETIEHIVNTDFFLSEINRVLKDSGILIISVPNINQWISIVMMIFFDLPPRFSARFRSPHVRDFTFRTIKTAVETFGFEIIERSGTGLFLPAIKRNVFLFLSKIFPRLGAEIVLYCRKKKNVIYDKNQVIRF